MKLLFLFLTFLLVMPPVAEAQVRTGGADPIILLTESEDRITKRMNERMKFCKINIYADFKNILSIVTYLKFIEALKPSWIFCPSRDPDWDSSMECLLKGEEGDELETFLIFMDSIVIEEGLSYENFHYFVKTYGLTKEEALSTSKYLKDRIKKYSKKKSSNKKPKWKH